MDVGTNITVELMMTIIGPVVGVVVWLIRLEGRVNLLDARYIEIKTDLDYIRARLDQALTRRGGEHDA